MEVIRRYPGSKWWKVDFHAHTPASDSYGRGDKSVPLATTAEIWLKSAMLAKLDAVVVTDHNSGDWIDILNEQYKELFERKEKPDWLRPLVIFPGVEVAVREGDFIMPLIVIFDVASGRDAVVSFLGKCEIFSRHGDASNLIVARTFEEVVKIARKMGAIAVSLRIDESEKLLDTLNMVDSSFLAKKLDGIFTMKVANPRLWDRIEGPLKKVVANMAKVRGSDSYRPEEVGRGFSWIKMGSISIDQLEKALREPDLAVKNQDDSPNRPPEIFLNKLTITSMSHCGRIKDKPFELDFHPHFNAIIGGRGSGKSTALESIRIATRREEELDGSPLRKELDRFMAFPKDNGVMLHDTCIQLEVSRRGKPYRLSWRKDGSEPVLEEWTDSQWTPSDTGNIQDRFPLSIYSQKQISELSSDPRGLIEAIDRTPDVGHTEWLSRWERTKSQYLQLRERLRELRLQIDAKSNLEIQLRDIENDMKSYEERGYDEILNLFKLRTKQRDGLVLPKSWDNIEGHLQSLQDLLHMPQFPNELFADNDETAEELKTLHSETSDKIDRIRESFDTLGNAFREAREQYNAKVSATGWHKSLEESESKYHEFESEINNASGNMNAQTSAYGQWVERRSQLQMQLQQIDTLRKDAFDVVRQIRSVYAEMRKLREELYIKRADFIRKVIGKSPYVRMELVPFGDVSSLEEDYRNIIGLNDGSFESSILDEGKNNKEGLLAPLYNWEDADVAPGQSLEVHLRRLLSDVKGRTLHLAHGTQEDSGFGKRLSRIIEDQPDVVDHLLCWWPEDLLKIKYSKSPQSGKFYDLEKGSAGQKAAAILAFLLSYGDEPLVIDQPEDDLDNILISDLIVGQLNANKYHRQIIIVTHNPNIVVNGDAEQVHVLCYINGQIMLDLQGGLDRREVRRSICNVIEGGREALEKRYKRLTALK